MTQRIRNENVETLQPIDEIALPIKILNPNVKKFEAAKLEEQEDYLKVLERKYKNSADYLESQVNLYDLRQSNDTNEKVTVERKIHNLIDQKLNDLDIKKLLLKFIFQKIKHNISAIILKSREINHKLDQEADKLEEIKQQTENANFLFENKQTLSNLIAPKTAQDQVDDNLQLFMNKDKNGQRLSTTLMLDSLKKKMNDNEKMIHNCQVITNKETSTLKEVSEDLEQEFIKKICEELQLDAYDLLSVNKNGESQRKEEEFRINILENGLNEQEKEILKKNEDMSKRDRRIVLLDIQGKRQMEKKMIQEVDKLEQFANDYHKDCIQKQSNKKLQYLHNLIQLETKKMIQKLQNENQILKKQFDDIQEVYQQAQRASLINKVQSSFNFSQKNHLDSNHLTSHELNLTDMANQFVLPSTSNQNIDDALTNHSNTNLANNNNLQNVQSHQSRSIDDINRIDQNFKLSTNFKSTYNRFSLSTRNEETRNHDHFESQTSSRKFLSQPKRGSVFRLSDDNDVEFLKTTMFEHIKAGSETSRSRVKIEVPNSMMSSEYSLKSPNFNNQIIINSKYTIGAGPLLVNKSKNFSHHSIDSDMASKIQQTPTKSTFSQQSENKLRRSSIDDHTTLPNPNTNSQQQSQLDNQKFENSQTILDMNELKENSNQIEDVKKQFFQKYIECKQSAVSSTQEKNTILKKINQLKQNADRKFQELAFVQGEALDYNSPEFQLYIQTTDLKKQIGNYLVNRIPIEQRTKLLYNYHLQENRKHDYDKMINEMDSLNKPDDEVFTQYH